VAITPSASLANVKYFYECLAFLTQFLKNGPYDDNIGSFPATSLYKWSGSINYRDVDAAVVNPDFAVVGTKSFGNEAGSYL